MNKMKEASTSSKITSHTSIKMEACRHECCCQKVSQNARVHGAVGYCKCYDSARRSWDRCRWQGRCPMMTSTLLLMAILLLHLTAVQSQLTPDRLRSFPPLFNAAENRPVVTDPSQSTCGYPERNAYCKSSTIVNSLDVCYPEICVQTCPTRETLPSHTSLLDATSAGTRTCIEIDTVNVRPDSSGETSTFFSGAGPTCFLTPRSIPALGPNGAFTITVWIWQEDSNDGVILEKFTTDSEIVLRLQVSESQVTLLYRSINGLSGVTLNETISSRIWTHLAIQVYERSISFFLDGLHAGFSPVLAESLSSVIQDKTGQVRVGQTAQGSLQFLGRLQDFRFYSETLSNREIELVYSGTFPSVRIQTACRCPPSHPRVRPTQTHYCIKNGEPDNTGNQILRLNEDAHPVEFINDGDSNSIWISSFQNNVALTLDLGDVFQVFYVVLQFYSSMPKGVTMEKQANESSTWETWQLYADDCQTRFSVPNNGPLPDPTAVNCLQFGSPSLPLPSSKGNITFNVLSPEPVPRPGYNDFYNARGLYDFVAASKVRVKLDEHFNVTELRHSYHGLFELIISARCQCNGHAPNCDTDSLPYRCNCSVLSHTEGDKCERCQPLFNDKAYRRGDPITAYNCKECQCYGHADSCVYDPSVDLFPEDHEQGGGGVCVNCRHNTVGRNCDSCAVNFFRPEGRSMYSENVCEPCACNSSGVVDNTMDCAKVGGLCSCKSQVEGRTCDTCKPGYYNLEGNNPSGCTRCGCSTAGSAQGDRTCHPTTGQCNCKTNVRNRQCNTCDYGYYNLNISNPEGCLPCNCNPRGSSNTFCDPGRGQCSCKANVVGRQCDQCAEGYFNFEAGCEVCDCDLQGTEPGTTCDKVTGQCVCKTNTQGLRCDQCEDGAYSFGGSFALGCISCNCDPEGTEPGASICDKTSGLCDCKANVVGRGCNQCGGSTWGLNATNPLGCQPCGCDPSGTQRGGQVPVNELTCNQNSGQCTCLTNRDGRQCDDCVSGFYADESPGGGCVACQCHPRGSLPGTVCDSLSGQCQCRSGGSGVTGQSCDTCLLTYYNFDQGTGRCSPCNCHPAGSLNDTCNAVTGQCDCKEFVQGLQCDRCVPGSSLLDINNPYGCSKAPAQQPPPEHVPISPSVLQLSWLPPDYPNGVIKAYNVYRNGILAGTVNSNASRVIYNDTGLTPFTRYSYIIEAVNDFGTVRSEPITFITPAGVPGGVVTLQVSNRGARAADFRWNVPTQPNGEIQRYALRSMTDVSPNVTTEHWEGLATSQTLTDLRPFTGYSFTVQVCTAAGCLSSDPVTFTTLSALAEGQDPPTITPLTSTELFVQWNHPRFPNGIISFYELWMRKATPLDTPPAEATRIFHPSGQFNPRPSLDPEENALPPPQTNYSVTGLDPYTAYQFQVLAQNDAGKTPGQWATSRTLEAAPLSTPAPVVLAVSSRRLNITWASPSDDQARGVILSFRLFQFKAADPMTNPFSPPFTWQLVQQAGADVNHAVVADLTPYMDYRFYVEACNTISCTQSTEGVGRTLAAAPEGLRKPLVEGVNSSAIEITWLPPEFVNGPPPVYKVERTSTALNYPSQVVRGTRFPGQGFYKFPPDTIPQNVGFTGIEFWFRTYAKKGLLFFTASDGQQEEFILIQFVAGRPRFVFDPQACLQVVELVGLDDSVTYDDGGWHKLVATRIGSQGRLLIDDAISGCPAIAQPTNDEGLPYNDGNWHHLIARRQEKSGFINIDGTFSGEAVIRCDQGNVIGTNTGVYIGGLDPNFQLRRNFGAQDRRAALVDRGFRGCIRDMKILKQVSPVELWEELDWQTAEVNEQAFPNWEGCPMNLETGVHYMGRGFAALPATIFNGGDVFSISLTFRSELRSGLLFFAHGGRGIFVLGELRDGSVYLEVGNAQKRMSVTYASSPSTNFCDGQWRRVTFAKEGEQVNITVRDQGSQASGNAAVAMELITVSRVYIGGVPAGSEAEQFLRDNGVQAAGGYGGCLSDISINENLLTNFADQVEELLNVNLDGCPQYRVPAVTCQTSLEQEIYRGTDNRTIDQGLQPYTEYLYRITAENSAGSGSSPWRNGKTQEAAPESVNAPTSATSPEGHVIQVFWSHPTNSPGLLSRLALRAYNNQSPEEGVLETNITDTSVRTGTIPDVIPYTSYTVKLVACTSGGCTESEGGTTVVTRQEAPEEIPTPTADPGPTHLLVRWDTPGRPNGVITGYILYMNTVEVYSGGQTIFNATSLQVFTGYMFYVEACTRQGCASGPSAVLTTSQLPPSSMLPPVLQALGTNQVEARWFAPGQLNGILERYQLFVSVVEPEVGELVYNNSDLFLTYVIPNLNAGTTYFIRAAACTGGGCRLSAPSSVTTEESAPEGVPDPVVTSPGPTQLTVTWGLPRLPNGVIVRYELFHNGLKEFDTPDRREYPVSNLLPYSIHSFRVGACTVKGCGYSRVVEARTQEDAPRGFVNIVGVQVVDARTVSLQWSPPDTPNGLIYYDVYFTGLYYINPENWNYNVTEDRRSLYRNMTDSTPVVIEGLIPHSSYSIQVNASNTKGFLLSSIILADMPQGTPDGVRPPDLRSPSPTSIMATWRPVGRDNADTPPTYTLQMRAISPGANTIDVFGPSTSMTYTVDGLSPFTEYELRVVARNRFGPTLSTWQSMYTKQAEPASLDPPRIISVMSNYIDLEWNAPLQPNGILTEYVIYQNNALRQSVGANVTSLRADGLEANTLYMFKLSACTVAGCTLSGESSTVRTLQAAPDGIPAPSLTSPTPASVQVVWSEPAKPNGIIRQYTIERRLKGENSTVTVTTVSVLVATVFTDSSPELSPFTTYEYRILGVNDVGTGAGPWAEIVTASSRPGGMRAPTVRVLGPRTLEVRWEEPIRPNGELEYYSIQVAPLPRQIVNTSKRVIVFYSLTPYTSYTVTVAACTAGGCSESPGVTVLTQTTTPEGLLPPSPIPVSQTMIAVTWQRPFYPNGPDIRYELNGRTLRRPLGPDGSDFGLWRSLYTGNSTYYEHRGLTLFTFYQYQVTVFNSFGQLTSSPSNEVATFGGVPQRPADVSVRALDHTSLWVNWTTPSVTDLQGAVQTFTLAYTSTSDSGSTVLGPDVNSTVLGDLSPNTEYSVTLTITINGGASIESPAVIATTMDGAPEGLAPPQLLPVSDNALQVVWTEPDRPNGQVTAYFIYLDGNRITTNQTSAGSHIINDLQPYTVYSVQMEVCTVHDCVRSNITRGTTAEARPTGVTPPNLVTQGPNTIHVSWITPENPNGIILNYDLTRVTVLPCSQVQKPSVTPPSRKCSYLSCSRQESVCGNTCYSGPKVCCDGVVHDAQPSYECCGKSYLPARSAPDDVCCGGRFYRRRDNYRCCGNRYLVVLPGQVCCPDSNQDRVAVGYGDTCCGTIPHSSSGAQICCAGRLQSRYGQQCCGQAVVSDELTCCGNLTHGQPYTPGPGYQCCGADYVQEDRHLCCVTDTGQAKVHSYPNSSMKAVSNQKCCGLEVISSGLACCNYLGYNPALQACADRAQQGQGCGTGTLCAISQTNSAYCNQCDFDRVNNVCTLVPQSPQTSPDNTPEEENSLGDCDVEKKVIYTGLALSYTDGGLSPFTRYRYSVTVTNSAGSTESDENSALTAQTVPQSLAPPMFKVYPDRLYVIYLTWRPPVQPNGEIIRYTLTRDGLEVYRGLALQFTDDNTILPYRSYTYVLSACTVVGCAAANPISVATAQAPPENMQPPTLTVLSATSIQLEWSPPDVSNGLITRYSVLMNGVDSIFNTTGLQHVVTGLSPYTDYTLAVRVCTSAGCTDSSNVTATTLQARPQGVQALRLLILSSTALQLFWSPPGIPNGEITQYKVFQTTSGKTTLAYSGNAQSLTTTLSSLIPGATYTFGLEVANGGGASNSSLTAIDMPLITPLNIPPPKTVSVLSSTSISVKWDDLQNITRQQTQREIDQYRVLLNGGSKSEIDRGVGLSLSTVVGGLQPYTEYSVRIRVCLQGVANGCGTGPDLKATTFEAPPTGQVAPVVTALGADMVDISWDPPSKPNGLIQNYRIRQRAVGSTSDILINQVNNNTFSFRHAGPDLQPFSEYEYKVTAVNGAGEVDSLWSAVRTLETPPIGIQEPVVSVTGAYGMQVTWTQPRRTNGIIQTYDIQYVFLSNDPTIVNPITTVTVAGTQRSAGISGLKPFTQYNVRVAAKNSAGSAVSNWVSMQTGEASPSGLGDFTIEKLTSGEAVILRWGVPVEPNGDITTYSVYENGNEVAVYQGLNREFEFRRLQPYTEYSVRLEACTLAGCTQTPVQKFTTAEIPPAAQQIPTLGPVNATNVVLTWKKPLNPNGKILSYEVLRLTVARRRRRQAPEGIVVYKTTDTDKESYEFVDSGLRPNTRYQYKIRAINSMGFSDSPWITVDTDQAPPTGVLPPIVDFVAGDVHSLFITWSPPDQTNGILQSYRLQRNDTIPPWSFTMSDAREFTDRNLQAYTVYSYTITACNAGGCTESLPTLLRTKETAPLLTMPPLLQAVSSTAIKATWQKPEITNGEITQYQLSRDGQIAYTGLLREFTSGGLTPFKEYEFKLAACTNGGCTDSAPVQGRPEASPPTDMAQPVLRVLSASAIEVSWRPPRNPNGIITSYDVRRNDSLVYTESLAIAGILRTAYTDYNLEAGKKYSYIVMATNSEGSVTSPSAVAETYSSSPSGMKPPQLVPLTAHSIQVSWEAPESPNGDLRNYTLYQENEVKYSGPVNRLMYVVPSLLPWTEYMFRIQVCTDRGCELSSPATTRTLEAPPENQAAPQLVASADFTGTHNGVRVSWAPPGNPNGEITHYVIHRQRLTKSDTAGNQYGEIVLVFNGTRLDYFDDDALVRPYTFYRYMVTAGNRVGSTASLWTEVFTKEAPPRGVPPPVVLNITSRTVTVRMSPPTQPNGVIMEYNVRVNGTVRSRGPGTALVQTAGSTDSLTPYSTYLIQTEACTRPGCSLSDAVVIKTSEATPTGLSSILIGDVGPTSAELSWAPPTYPNGLITRYVVYQREGCPRSPQAFPQPCVTGDPVQVYSGLDLGVTAPDLRAYTHYEFQVRVENTQGLGDFADWVSTETKKAAPQYVKVPMLSKNGTRAVIDWTNSFHLNSRLQTYTLWADDQKVMEGILSVYSVERTLRDAKITFKIEAQTETGTATSPDIIFDPNAVDNIATTVAPVPGSQTGGSPVYQEVWFIILMCVIALLLLFIILAFCIKRMTRPRPYIRERHPLEPRQKKATYDLSGSVVVDDFPTRPTSAAHASPAEFGVINPAFVNPTMRPLTLESDDLDLTFDNISKPSKYDEDDLSWGKPQDSGLYDDDLDSLNAPSYSITKEQTIFTDTHL